MDRANPMLGVLFAPAGGDGAGDDAAPEPVVWLWPENADAWGHWCAVQTQWSIGMGGATGLNYAGVCAYLADATKGRAKRVEVFEGIRAAERATLEVWNQQRKDRNRD